MRLEVDGLAFGYRDRVVGRDVSFHLAAGEVLCLLGPNGSGKTTLFKTVLRLLEPKAGTVAIDGERSPAGRAGGWRAASATCRRPRRRCSRSRSGRSS
jgi:ABC-type cobalamin/Fe3+-siderophores transport system ATPase subunit